MSAATYEQHDVSHREFRDNTIIHQGNVQENAYYGLPRSPARADVIRAIPYPRNEDLVHRQDPIERLDKLLPQTPGFFSAALWGLGGSGKTHIALDYAYRRCDDDDQCCIFWVHADNEATFISDYKTIGKRLGVDEQLEGSDLLDAVCSKIGKQPKWVMVLDGADDLGLFGVGPPQQEVKENLRKYIPHTLRGTILWTSRDAHITGTLVSARHGFEVQPMAVEEAITLLGKTTDKPSISDEVGVYALLDDLQHLPLAISQAGAYMRRMKKTVREYQSLLAQGRARWDVLEISDSGRHLRPEVSNSVLETWRISIEQIRAESIMSYRILHAIAYTDNQDIPHELMATAARRSGMSKEISDWQAMDLEVQQAITRLREFSFLSIHDKEEGCRSYEMHKLVHEAVRYGLRARGGLRIEFGEMMGSGSEIENSEAHYSKMALQIIDELFPLSEGKPWARCEQYTAHAIRVGEWAEGSGTELDTAKLLSRVSGCLCNQGRWREKESVDERAWGLRKAILGEKHPDIIRSIADLAMIYYTRGQYNKAELLIV